MGFFGTGTVTSINEELKDPSALREQFVLDELSMLTDDQKQAFTESEECKAMLEKGIISRRTLVRLSKTDDLSRRMKMAAFQLAQEHKDPLWAQLVKNRVKERMLIKKIAQKYSSKSTMVAKQGQREYLKAAMGKKFMRPISTSGV